MILRAAVCNHREFAVETEISKFFIFSLKKPFGEKFSSITIEVSKEFSFSRKPAKSEMLRSSHSRLLSTAKNYTNFKALGKKRYLV